MTQAAPPDINTRGSLAAALNARRKEQPIGIVLVSWDHAYKVGDYVFCEVATSGCWIISMPMTDDQIKEHRQRNPRSLLRDWLTVIGVPPHYCKRVL